MTVETTTNTAVFTGNGVADEFAYNFYVSDASQLIVQRRVIATGLVDKTYTSSEYTVSGIGTDSGAITLLAGALASTYQLVVQRIVPYKQELDLVNQGGFYPETIEEQLDLMVMQTQQIADEVERGIKVPVGENSITIPTAAVRANQFPVWLADGSLGSSSGTGADDGLRADLASFDNNKGARLISTEGSGNVQDLKDIFDETVYVYPVGAAGDGVTNDAAIIDALNVAGQVVNLRGKDYAYTGALDMTKARFINGQIISSLQGTLDFRYSAIFGNATITVGSGGTIKRLRDLFPYLRTKAVLGTLTVTLLEINTPNDATGSMALDVQDAYHPNIARIAFEGPAFSGAQGVVRNSAMPGGADLAAATAADYAYIESRMPASIYLVGDDDLLGSYGVNFLGGASRFTRIWIDGHVRYGTSVNWSGSHASKTFGGGRIVFEDCAITGGVWGSTLIDTGLTLLGTANFFGYQISGGAWFMEGGFVYKPPTTHLDIYYPKVAPHADMPKYGFNANRTRFLIEPDGFNAPNVHVFGPFLFGVFVTDCTGDIPNPEFDGPTIGITAIGGNIYWGTPKGRNADPANTSLTTGGSQPGTPDNAGQGAYIYFGRGHRGSIRGADLAQVICSYFFRSDGGHIQSGASLTFAVDDCKATIKAFSFFASRGNTLAPNITNPQAGSVDQLGVSWGSDVYLPSKVGVTLDLAANTWTNGNLIAE